MDKERLNRYLLEAAQELRGSLDFWLEHGWDRKYGGIMTCLDRQGRPYCEDKSVWMQGRAAWAYASVCNLFGKRDEWLAFSKSCLDFLEAHCLNRAAGGRLYFTTTREGEPIRQRRYYAGEGFYLMGNAEYAAAAGDAAALKRARGMHERIWALNHGAEDPVGLGPKNLPGVRPGRSLATYMGYLSHSALMRRCDPQNVALYDERARDCLRTVVRDFIKPDLRCTLEFVRPDGGVYHGFCSGREVSIGHDLETAWIMLEEAVYENSSELVENAAQVFDFAVEKGWDTRYGGLFYSVDCDGFPCESYEHDMKIWWPHAEMILSALMLYQATGREAYFDWFEKAWAYSMEHFSDKQFGEWLGYLSRDGLPTEPPAKGTTFKGPLHVIRTMSKAIGILQALGADAQVTI